MTILHDSHTGTSRPSVTFETKCWERDWRFLLTTGYLDEMIARNCFRFARRALFINNVEDVPAVVRHAREKLRSGVLTEFHVVEDHAEAALRFYGLTRAGLGRGYVYSIAELVALYLARTDYLLHFSSDSLLAQPTPWIEAALSLFQSNPRIKVANCSWTPDATEVAAEALEQSEAFYLGQGFSDQCYLVRTADFRAPIYGEEQPASARYPEYGGNSFEKRVDAWMRRHNHRRATFRLGHYVHHGFRR